MTRCVFWLLVLASLSGLLFGYETGAAAGGLNEVSDLWQAAASGWLLLSSGTLIGALVGALAAGKVSDMVGRRDVIMATAALFTLGAFSSALAPSVDALFLARFVVGLAVGAVSVAAPMYIAEVGPARSRGALICVFQLAITIGLLLAYLGNSLLHARPDGWRIMLGLGAIPGTLLSGATLFLEESPLWLGLDAASAEPQERPSVGRLASPDPLPLLFSLAGRRSLFLCTALFLFQQFVGINAIFYFAPGLLANMEFGLGSDARVGSVLLLVILNTVVTALALLLIDRIGRRRLLLTSFILAAAGLLAIALGVTLAADSPATAHRLAAGGCFLYIGGFALGVGPVPWVTLSETGPIEIRGLAIGLAAASHWLFDGLASPMGLLLHGNVTISVTFLFYGLVAVGGFFLFRTILPELKGLSLAEIDEAARQAAARIGDSRFVHYTITALVTTGGLLTGFNFAATAITLVLIAKNWNLSPLAQGAVASAIVLGLAAGSFIAGSLSDRFGRRYVLMSTSALFVAGAFISAVAFSLPVLLAGRAMVGLAIGIASPTTGVYVAEIAPMAIRGRLLSFEAVTYGVGAILAYCVGLVFEPTAESWRYIFATIALPSTLYGLVLLPLPESPRWLAANGRPVAARRVLRRLNETDVEAVIANLAEPGETGGTGHGGWSGLLAKAHRPIVLLGLIIMFLIVFGGWDMVLFYAPTVLVEIGFADTLVSFLATLGLGVVFLLMTIISLAIIDRVGRKPMVVIGLLIMSACLALMATFAWAADQIGSAMRWGLVAMLAVFVGVFALTLGQVGEIVVAEIYPQAIRGAATSFSHGMRSLFALAFTLTFPLVLNRLGLHITFLTYAVIDGVGTLYLLRFLPETKDRSLEDIARFWYKGRSEAGVSRVNSAP